MCFRRGRTFSDQFTTNLVVSDIAVFVLKRDIKLQPTNHYKFSAKSHGKRKLKIIQHLGK